MATQVTKWAATDGKLFDSQADAEAHEHQINILRYVGILVRKLTHNMVVRSEDLDMLCQNLNFEMHSRNTRELFKQLLDMTAEPSNS